MPVLGSLRNTPSGVPIYTTPLTRSQVMAEGAVTLTCVLMVPLQPAPQPTGSGKRRIPPVSATHTWLATMARPCAGLWLMVTAILSTVWVAAEGVLMRNMLALAVMLA